MKITFAVALCLLLILPGCGGTYSKLQEVPLGRETFYDADKTSVCGIKINNAKVNGRNLDVTVSRIYCTPEVNAEKYKKIRHSGRRPNPVATTLAAPIVVLVDGPKEIVQGLVGEHHKYESIHYRDKKSTGRSKQEYKPFPGKTLWANLLINSVNRHNGEHLTKDFQWEKVITNTNSTFSFPLATHLETLEEQPQSIDYKLSVKLAASDSGRHSSYATGITEQELDEFKLTSSLWQEKAKERALQALPKQEQRQLYQQELISALKNEDYPLALKNFQRFERLAMDLPTSFQYHYGKTLLEVGDKELAKQKFQAYLKQAGEQGRYARQASQYLADLNQ